MRMRFSTNPRSHQLSGQKGSLWRVAYPGLERGRHCQRVWLKRKVPAWPLRAQERPRLAHFRWDSSTKGQRNLRSKVLELLRLHRWEATALCLGRSCLTVSRAIEARGGTLYQAARESFQPEGLFDRDRAVHGLGHRTQNKTALCNRD